MCSTDGAVLLHVAGLVAIYSTWHFVVWKGGPHLHTELQAHTTQADGLGKGPGFVGSRDGLASWLWVSVGGLGAACVAILSRIPNACAWIRGQAVNLLVAGPSGGVGVVATGAFVCELQLQTASSLFLMVVVVRVFLRHNTLGCCI